MTSVGDTLRRERLQRKLDLDQISSELKISRRLLDAIEADQYERLPGSIFAKAFVRQYAALLGLDGEALASQVQHAIEPPSLEMPEKSRPAVTPIEVPRVEEWKSVGDKGFRLTGSLPAAVLVVVVMLICSAVYAWMQRPRTSPAPAQTTHANPPAVAPAQPAPQPAVPPLQSAQPTQIPPSNPASVETAAQQPAAPASGTSATDSKLAPPPPGPPGPVHVELVADELVWVLAKVDGKYVFSGTMDANTRRVLDGANDVLLRLGNAGGVSISLNGKSIGSPGPKGQVRTLQFTSGGFQTVSAKPAPSAPLDPLDR